MTSQGRGVAKWKQYHARGQRNGITPNLHGQTWLRLGSSPRLPALWPGNAREISSDKVPKEDKIQVCVPEQTSPDQHFFFGMEARRVDRNCAFPWDGGSQFYSWMIDFPEQNNKNHFNCWLKNHSLISDDLLLLHFQLGNHVNISSMLPSITHSDRTPPK